MTDGPKLADHIKVTENGLEIDGQPFPWYITEEGATIQVAYREMPAVTITLFANRVEADHRSPHYRQ